MLDDETRTAVWNRCKNTPELLGYDPGAIGIPGWDNPTSPAFATLRLTPGAYASCPARSPAALFESV